MQVFTGIQSFGLLVQLLESEIKAMGFTCILLIGIGVTFQANAAVHDTPLLFDRFSHIRCAEEIVRLDNYARELKGVPNATAVIVGYGGRTDTRRGEIPARLLAARDYLLKEREIERTRVIILDGGYREELSIELWIIANREDAHLLINSTVHSKDVKLKKRSIKKWEYKCKPLPEGCPQNPSSQQLVDTGTAEAADRSEDRTVREVLWREV